VFVGVEVFVGVFVMVGVEVAVPVAVKVGVGPVKTFPPPNLSEAEVQLFGKSSTAKQIHCLTSIHTGASN
jgi:hypothetical protein